MANASPRGKTRKKKAEQTPAPAAPPAGEFTVESEDIPTLLRIVEEMHEAMVEYESWVAKFGHTSHATAEILADSLYWTTRRVEDAVEYGHQRIKSAALTQSGLVGVIKVLGEVSTIVIDKLAPLQKSAKDHDHDDPTFLQLSKTAKPVTLGEYPLAALSMVKDSVHSWINKPAGSPPSDLKDRGGNENWEPLKPLTDEHQRVFDFIQKNPGRTGRQIVNALGISSESNLTCHIIPNLRPHGVRNRKGFGYYVEPKPNG